MPAPTTMKSALECSGMGTPLNAAAQTRWRERPAGAIVELGPALELAMLRSLFLAVCLASLAGCATVPDPAGGPPWRDSNFEYMQSLVTTTREDLFHLDPELLAQVLSPMPNDMSPSQKLNHLLTVVFGPDKRRFTYSPGHSTTASETWRR